MQLARRTLGGAARSALPHRHRAEAPVECPVRDRMTTFMVADALGDIRGGNDGLFRDDTRVLSRRVLTIGDIPPALLRSAVGDDNVVLRINATNRPLPKRGEHMRPPRA